MVLDSAKFFESKSKFSVTPSGRLLGPAASSKIMVNASSCDPGNILLLFSVGIKTMAIELSLYPKVTDLLGSWRSKTDPFCLVKGKGSRCMPNFLVKNFSDSCILDTRINGATIGSLAMLITISNGIPPGDVRST